MDNFELFLFLYRCHLSYAIDDGSVQSNLAYMFTCMVASDEEQNIFEFKFEYASKFIE